MLLLSLLPSSRPNKLLTDEVNTQLTQEQVLLKGMRYESMGYKVLSIDGVGHEFMEYEFSTCTRIHLHYNNPKKGCVQ